MQVAQTLLLVLAAVLFVVWLAVALARLPPFTGAEVRAELRYGTLVRLIALFAALTMPLLALAVIGFLPWSNITALLRAGCVLLILCLPGGLLLLEVQRVRIAVTTAGLIADSPWRGRRELPWNEIEHVTFSALNRWLVIRGRNGQTIRASLFLAEFPKLLAALKAHVPSPRRLDVRRLIERV